MAFNGQITAGQPILTRSRPLQNNDPDVVTWPWPRIIATQYHSLLFMRDAILDLVVWEMTLNAMGGWEGYLVGSLGPAANVLTIDVADFGPFYVICTSGLGTRTWVRDITKTITGGSRTSLQWLDEVDSPVMVTVCNNRGQVVGGNISSFQNLDSNGLIWSAIGNFDFDPQNDLTAGSSSLVENRSSGIPCYIYKVMAMHEAVIVYTNYGNVAIFDQMEGGIFTYGVVPLKGVGINSGTHVAGSLYLHGFIDLNNEFWLLENTSFRTLSQTGGKLTNRGYKDQIEELKSTDTGLIVSYVPIHNRFYISNGTSTLVINDFGACMVHQAVSGAVIGWDNRLYGTFRDYGDHEARIVFDGNDFQSRGLKTVESLLCGTLCSPTTVVQGASQAKYRMRDEFIQGRWKPANERGEIFIRSTALEHRLAVRWSEYVGSSIWSLEANVKFPDARFRRGIATSSTGQEQVSG